ncbi:MAG: NuoF family protein [Anaerolineales bacterium]
MLNDKLAQIASDEKEAGKKYKHQIHVCVASGCLTAHSDKIKDALSAEIERRGLTGECRVKGVGCLGLCAGGPTVSVEPDGAFYQKVSESDVAEIVANLGKAPVERLEVPADQPFFGRQMKIALENSGKIDPTRIEDYIAVGGYSVLQKVLNTMSPAEVLDQVSRSGLRGRGGAGYPTGLKWGTVAKNQGPQKYVICNADEGDPGAFMDRSVLESDPHRVLEGMAIAAYAVGASRGYLYVRAEYPLAIGHLKNAITQAERLGLLGNRIFDNPFSFHLEVRVGAGAYVCGEETALIASIEGKRGTPSPRPPYPAEHGLWGCPTLINNVETYANVTPILRNGGDWYAAIGKDKSKGTKVFSMTGEINNTGVIEVPMGITLREIIYEIGGGLPEGKRFKAVQTGGPGGGCIPEQYLDTPIDYESLTKLGSMMGSGGMIVIGETTCMVDMAKFFMEFCMSESCGKCVPCRVGTAEMYDLLDKITRGEATLDDLAMLEKLADMVKSMSLCGLGQGAPSPVQSTLRYFREEYMAHIVDKHCPAGVCNIAVAERTTA